MAAADLDGGDRRPVLLGGVVLADNAGVVVAIGLIGADVRGHRARSGPELVAELMGPRAWRGPPSPGLPLVFVPIFLMALAWLGLPDHVAAGP